MRGLCEVSPRKYNGDDIRISTLEAVVGALRCFGEDPATCDAMLENLKMKVDATLTQKRRPAHYGDNTEPSGHPFDPETNLPTVCNSDDLEVDRLAQPSKKGGGESTQRGSSRKTTKCFAADFLDSPFRTSEGVDAGRWCPDGWGHGTHVSKLAGLQVRYKDKSKTVKLLLYRPPTSRRTPPPGQLPQHMTKKVPKGPKAQAGSRYDPAA